MIRAKYNVIFDKLKIFESLHKSVWQQLVVTTIPSSLVIPLSHVPAFLQPLEIALKVAPFLVTVLN